MLIAEDTWKIWTGGVIFALLVRREEKSSLAFFRLKRHCSHFKVPVEPKGLFPALVELVLSATGEHDCGYPATCCPDCPWTP